MFYNQALKDDQIPSRHASQISSFDSSSDTLTNSKSSFINKKYRYSTIDLKIEEIYKSIEKSKISNL